ncbi:citryl-CoA lyase [Marinicaulis aureus]|uniref:citrate synthase (unknown stereospecificity) n=1 Tax=Hyphococcus aureus TaxID=2666033 RepID=A0ABW1KU63_9PROT
MAQEKERPKSRIATHSETAIYVRDANLVDDLIGKVSFTQMLYFQIFGRHPTEGEVKILDAVLVTLMEHGFTPSVIVARLIAMSSPEATQAAIAAGLLGVGGKFVGTTEAAAHLLRRIVEAPEGVEAAARAEAERHRKEKLLLPGFGHPFHKPDDPRPARLFEVAAEAGHSGKYIAALKQFSKEVDEVYGRHLTINATSAIAALLCEIDVPVHIMRGFSVLSRCAGLIGHLNEEHELPVARTLWENAEASVDYLGVVQVRHE